MIVTDQFNNCWDIEYNKMFLNIRQNYTIIHLQSKTQMQFRVKIFNAELLQNHPETTVPPSSWLVWWQRTLARHIQAASTSLPGSCRHLYPEAEKNQPSKHCQTLQLQFYYNIWLLVLWQVLSTLLSTHYSSKSHTANLLTCTCLTVQLTVYCSK